MDSANDILDSSWIANILSISFSLVIFLLGVPVFFIQTYVPEDLRKYYFRLSNTHTKHLSISAWLLVLSIVFFGNHGFKFLLKDYFEHHTVTVLYFHYYGKPISIDTKDALMILYVTSFVFFVILFIYVYFRFINSVFKRENIKEQILNNIFDEYVNSAVSETDISRTHNELETKVKTTGDKLDELIELSIIFGNGVDRVNYYDHLFNLITVVVNNDFYTGKELKKYFEFILYPVFVKNFSSTNINELVKVINLCEIISSVYKSKQVETNYDKQYITDIFLFQLYVNFISNENIDQAKRCVHCMKKFNLNDTVLFRIYYYAFHKGVYTIIAEEIKTLSFDFVENGTVKVQKRHNYIAYLSFFYSENAVSREYVNEWLIFLKEGRFTLNRADILSSKTYFLKSSRIETAQKIDNFLADYDKINSQIRFMSIDRLSIIKDY